MYIDLEKINEVPTSLLEEIHTLAGYELMDREMTNSRTAFDLHGDGWNYSMHPIEDGYETHEWFEIIRKEYSHLEVKDVLAYSNSNYDPLTCPAAWLWDASLRPKPEWGVEVIWKEK